MILLVVFAYINDMRDGVFNFDQYFFLPFYFPLVAHLKRVYNNSEPRLLDPELKKLALSTFFICVVLSMGLIFLFSDIALYIIENILE